ncbi:hypothetical protein [Streptomyces inhibens]|nr:hypothetical protein [Streptomyces inhibens]
MVALPTMVVGVTAEFAVLSERCQGGSGNGNNSLAVLGSEY